MRLIAVLALVTSTLLPGGAAAQVVIGFADLAERLSPAVVNIYTQQELNREDGLPFFPEGSAIERFNQYRSDAPRIANSLGSGFVIDESGLVVTNHHVIDEADFVQVAFSDGRTFEAEIIGTDSVTDLAVLQIQSEERFPHVEFGDSEAARVGELVIAIGNPFGLGGSLSQGVISARGRETGGRYDDYIQTDVAINRGNSGGPLFNMDGEVIGVNTQILSPTGVSIGISLSIPSNLAEGVVQQLVEFGETRRGWIGLSVRDLSQSLAESYGLDGSYGALVSRVTRDGPAAEAGLRQGDVILTFNGEPLENSRSLPRLVADADIGSTLTLDIIRADERQTLDVEVGQLQEDVAATVSSGDGLPEATGNDRNRILGMAVTSITPTLRRRHQIHPDASGVVVVDVSSDSRAFGRIRVGDVIEQAEFNPIETVADLRRIVDGAGDRAVRLQINRAGQFVMEAVRS
ncbi:Do family serine endopeptidase [Maricaulis sp. D1M11]|uniref:Do family serine endopeptidase n=1 Tax=Maricaulis sp. D1M11 TaxID=3076117 RepID=UPI0039B53D09